MGKGSTPRPFAVSNQEYQNRWDAIFGRDNEKKNEEKSVGTAQSDRPRSDRSSNNTQANSGQTQVS